MKSASPLAITLGLLLTAGAAHAAKPAAKGPTSAEALLSELAKMRAFSARFEESKTLALLSTPLVTKGRLVFAPPGKLVRVTDAPAKSRVVLTKGTLTMVTAEGTQRIDLASQPAVRTLTSSLLSLLSGDLKGLQAAYTIAYATKGDRGWRLDLVPKDKKVGALVSRMSFLGEGLVVKRIDIEEASGDVAKTEILDPKVNAPLTDADKKLFEVP